MVNCAFSSCPEAQAPLAATNCPPVKSTRSVAVAQSCARKSVPLLPIQAWTPAPLRSGRNPAEKVRWTRSAAAPAALVDGVICRSAAVFTQAASTISPEHCNQPIVHENYGREKIPLFRKVRHSFPGTPPTSKRTTVEAPPVTAPPVVPPVAGAAGTAETAAGSVSVDVSAAGVLTAGGGLATAAPPFPPPLLWR